MTRAAPRSRPPEELSADQRAALAHWAQQREPWAVRELGDLIENCLDHHRAKGNTMADWPAAMRTWIRNERRWRGGAGGGTPRKPSGGGGGGLAGAAQAVARRLGLFDDEES